MSKTFAERASAELRREEAKAREIERRLDEAQALAPLATEQPEVVRAPLAGLWRKRRALLIINSKSGPNRDSLLRARELVDLLATFRIRVDVRVKLRKSQARKEARDASRQGRYDLIIAAGGDGTVEAVARGLLGSRATLGIIPLGTFNNVATSLGIPSDVRQACALIGCGVARPIDAGLIIARYMDKPRMFLEVSTIGLGAVVGMLGQHIEKGRWEEAAQTVPDVAGMSLTPTQVRIDDTTEYTANTLLVTVSNAPRAGAGLKLAAGARMDDGLLDVSVYQDLDQAALLARMLATLPDGWSDADGNLVWRARARSIEVRTARPMPVSIETKLVGVTPARFTARAGALSVIVGETDALLRPPSPALVHASARAAYALTSPAAHVDDRTTQVTADDGPGSRALQVVVPAAARSLEAVSSARGVATPLATAVLGLAAGSLLRQVAKRISVARRRR